MICSTPAFVLRAYDFRETSKIAIFFSRDFGKVKGILKGIRKDPRKFSSSLTPLSLNHIIFYRKRNSEIHLISQCDLLDDFGLSKGMLRSFMSSARVIELVDLLLPLEDPHHTVFTLIFDFLNTLKVNPLDAHLFFQVKILTLSGFKPRFDACVICETKIGEEAYFSHGRGGLLCRQCLRWDKSAEETLKGTIASILYIEKSNWQKCLRLQLSVSIKKQLERILDCFVHFHVGKILKSSSVSRDFLDL